MATPACNLKNPGCRKVQSRNRIMKRNLCLFLLLLAACFVTRAFAERQKYVPHPSLNEIKQGLESWGKLRPDYLKFETVGHSTGGHPILLATITDQNVSDDDKQVVLLTVTHAGDELTGCNGLLHLTRWLISDDPAAAKIRKNVITLVMPCLNPDGYVHMTADSPKSRTACHTNNQGKNLWQAYKWDRLSDPQSTPELVALLKVTDKYQPDASLDVHGNWYENYAMWESTAFSWGDSRAHTFCPAMVEQINLAAEQKGFLIVRPSEDSGRIKVTSPMSGAENHFYHVPNVLALCTFLYNRYHTLGFMCEAGFDDSVVARARRLLEFGTTRWRNEFYKGYPVNQIGGWGSMTVCAWGDTAKRRRRSRVELWKNSERLFYSIGLDQPAHSKMMAVCATNVPAVNRWIVDGTMPTILKRIKDHPQIDAAAIERFAGGAIPIKRFTNPKKNIHIRGYNPKNTSEEPIKHGLAMRLFIPYLDAQVVDARINGHPVTESATDGYQVRHDPGTIVQFNIPPGKVGDIHFVTCEYQTKKQHRQGFLPKDWKLDAEVK